MDALIDFDVTLDPQEPNVTFKATGLTDAALSATLEKIVLNAVTLNPVSDAAKLVAGPANALASLAPGVLKKALEGKKTVDIPLDKPLGTDITVNGQTVSVKLTSPELGSHDGMLMVSGTFVVS
ncbi:hypothetical protein GTW98_12985 [Streptomyces sp. SID8375]|uniref:hypothetical protein n=1 Tax=Streptomyces TaxID=1883 RepID=UPI00036A76B8|nr:MULTISPECIES: hypothetical protein [unclassified Streptomyces]MCW7988193.1 hypothetical protein [Streptomyces platensis subsp. clarensis]MCR8573613.1 hypothetical protein [Streptomyces sp. Isolate_219]MYT14533.1 hypothetical protein [Streptomyces sp. SID4951]MYX07709.1 hypothetical protein [Streptomyces sp. SID8375]SCK60093.1 hypothetical protein YWIDRAFT_03941 [Streptomyces sp. SceaMP-e96]